MVEESPRVAMLLTQEEAEYLFCLLLATEPSEQTDELLCRLAEVQRLLGRARGTEPEPLPVCCVSSKV
jgi:hypothetical protein